MIAVAYSQLKILVALILSIPADAMALTGSSTSGQVLWHHHTGLGYRYNVTDKIATSVGVVFPWKPILYRDTADDHSTFALIKGI